MAVKKPRLQWTKEDVHRLRLFADANIGVDTIAKSLGRTRASVKLKAHWLAMTSETGTSEKPSRWLKA